MLDPKKPICKCVTGGLNHQGFRTKMHWGLACACIAAMATLAGIAQNAGPPGDPQQSANAALPTPASPAHDANAQEGLLDRKTGQQDPSTAGIERRKQIADDSTRLLALAIALKTEVDKTNKDTLSLSVIRRADEIEKLAHSVKDKLKMIVGGG